MRLRSSWTVLATIRVLAVSLVLSLSAASSFVLAVEPGEILSDPDLEKRARALSAELRCLVCQNQSIDDSSAPLAKDLRVLVRDRLVAGDSDAAIRSFVVARYGEFVLLRPPLSMRTLALWLSPLVVLALAFAAAFRMMRRRVLPPAGINSVVLSPDEQARLDELLKDK